MFAELVEFGKRIRKGHDALGEERCNWDIVINEDGSFIDLIPCDISLVSEKLSSKKGSARLLLDKPEETLLGYNKHKLSDINEDLLEQKKKELSEDEKKYWRYIIKLKDYDTILELGPIFSFYNRHEEINKAIAAFQRFPSNKQKVNMTFMVNSKRLISLDVVKDSIISKYEARLKTSKSSDCRCAICGSDKYPVLDEPHGSIKMPKGQTAGSMLVSYNANAFESYNLKGNLNSGICTNCARNYVEALKHLVGNKYETTNEEGETVVKYTNRQKISDDSIVIFWTKKPDEDIDPFSDVCSPSEERIRKLFTSIASGDSQRVNTDVVNYFYSCTLSSAAARIAVRDWVSISISQYQKNLKHWFEDIATVQNEKTYYPGIDRILKNCIKKKSKPNNSDYKAQARIGTVLWHAALTGGYLPIMILQNVLDQIEHEKTTKNNKVFSIEKTTVIRLVLNRNPKNKYKMKEVLDEQNESKAYLCGRLFALICKLQYKSQGAVNSSIKDRFFASASNAPARVMGLLLTKYVPIYEKKAKGAYSKSISDITTKIGHFPDKFSIMERGEFALGYYYQFTAKQTYNNEQD